MTNKAFANVLQAISFSSIKETAFWFPHYSIWNSWLIISFIGILVGELRAQGNTATSLSLTKLVDKSIANRGDQLTYKLIVTNTGSSTTSNIMVRDSSDTGLRYVTDSAIVPTGTTFTHSSSTSLWTVATLSAGQSLTLTFQAVADSSGILYNRATIPGDTAVACTSVPVHVCTGDQFTFRLTAASGRSSYRWFKDNVEISGQTSNVLDVTTPGSYSLAVDNVSGRCPDFSCCSFIVIEDALPDYQARTLSTSCTTPAQSDGKIIVSGFNPAHTYQYSAGATFNEAASLSGAPKTVPASGILADNLANPASDASYTIRVYNGADCYIDKTVTLRPSACCSLSVTASAGPCAAATNTYSSTVLVSVTNSSAGTLTVTDGPLSMTFATTAVGSATFTALFTGLTSNSATHTVTVSLPGCSTASTTYTAPASCSVCVNPVVTIANRSQTICSGSTAPMPFSASVVSGTATTYAWYGPLSSTTVALGTAISGQTSATYQPNGGQVPGTYYYALLTLGNPASCTSITYASLTINPLPSAGQNQTLVCSQGAAPTSTTLAATGVASGSWSASPGNPASVSFSSGNALSTTVSGLTAPGTYTFVFTSPTSCTSNVTVLVPTCLCSLALAVTPGVCNPLTNQYSLSGTISLTNAQAGSLTLTDGQATTTLSITAGQTTASFSLTGLASGTGLHTVSLASSATTCGGASATYVAPLSCSVGVTLSATPGECQTATNQYTISGTLSLTNASAGTATITDGSLSTTVTVAAGATSVAYSLTGLTSGTNSHTVTVSYANQTISKTYMAPASCTVDIALSVTDPGICQLATNTYSTTGTISLTNAVAGTALVTDGVFSTTIAITAGQLSTTYSFTGLPTGTGSHTVIVTYANKTASTTYTAPLSCSVAPVCSVSATAKAVPVTCLGATPQANGQLVVSNFTTKYTYQYALGATFNANASLSGPAQPVPTGGVLVSNLANPTGSQPYTIRVYDGPTCYRDITVSLTPTVCTCPPSVCVPLLIRRTR